LRRDKEVRHLVSVSPISWNEGFSALKFSEFGVEISN